MYKLKLRPIGTSTGVILPKELLARLKVKRGDDLFAVETPDGYTLTADDAEFVRQMELAEDIMREDRSILKALAK
jgi:putative addiction module antidote